jgi:capsule polysaccharide export protein KpsC/LpsZ
LIWDASFEYKGGLFNNYIHWLDKTIQLIENDIDAHVVIKTHPAESARGTRESVFEYLTQQFDNIPDNVKVLPPDTDVNTYELINQLDAGIVFNSTVGLEMSYWGTPTVVAGDSHYCDFGFTYDPASMEEYRECISRLPDLKYTKEMQQLAKRYCYYFYFVKHISFPFITSSKDAGGMQMHPVAQEDLRPGTEPFDTIVNRIVAGKPVIGN